VIILIILNPDIRPDPFRHNLCKLFAWKVGLSFALVKVLGSVDEELEPANSSEDFCTGYILSEF
jgi:hypothetical protein